MAKQDTVKKVKKFTKKMKVKQMIVFFVLILVLAFLGVKLSFINYSNEDEYTKLVLEQQQESSTTIPFKRGDVLDRNGNILATSIKVYNMILDPKVMLSSEDYLEPTVALLLEYFDDIDETDLRSTISEKSNSRYVIYIKQLEYDQIKDFQAAMEKDSNVKGVWFEDEYKRCYPYDELASSVIGFTEKGNVGRWGIEEYYNESLNGLNGRSFSYYDRDNQKVTETRQATDGSTVVSTIDMNIQSICQKYVEQWVKEYKPKNVSVIVADPNNGEILAMVSSNNIYNLNNPRDLTRYYKESNIEKMSDKKKLNLLNKMWRNYCISDTFQAGSTIKPFTVAGAVEENKIDLEDTYMCDGGENVANYYVRCHLHSGHGEVTAEQSIMYSCNDALMQIAEKEGVKTFTDYQTIFNFGMKTGIDLPGETSCAGLLYNADNMTEIDLKTNSFGQNFNVTMVQMVAGFSSLINGGYYYEPHVVKQVINSSGAIEENVEKTLVKQTITKDVSDFLKQSLMNVTIGGTGRTARVSGYVVGGKTGTAQKENKEEDEYILSFLGFAPYDNPQVVCYAVVDAPKVDDPGSSSYASKLFSTVMTEVLPYMNIYPTEETETKKEEESKEQQTEENGEEGSEEQTDGDSENNNEETTGGDEDNNEESTDVFPSYDENPEGNVIDDETITNNEENTESQEESTDN